MILDIEVEEIDPNRMGFQVGVLEVEGSNTSGNITTSAGMGGTSFTMAWRGRKFRVDMKGVMLALVEREFPGDHSDLKEAFDA